MSKFWRKILIFGVLIVLSAMTINIILLWHLALYGRLPDPFTTLARKSCNFLFGSVVHRDAWQSAREFEAPENLATTRLPVFDLYFDIKSLESKLPKRKVDAIYKFPNYMPGRLETGGHRYNVEVSCRGNIWSHWYGPKKSLRLKFADNDYYSGIRLLNLNNPKFALPFAQTLSYELASSIGILSPRAFLVHLRLNDKYYGIMEAFEQPDRHFLEHFNRPVGDIYGEIRGTSEIWNKASSDLWQKYCTADNLSENDFSNLERLINILNKEDSRIFTQEITDVLEVDSFLRLYALEQIISSYHTNIHNIRIYYNPSTKRFEFILWDPMLLGSFYVLETPFYDDTSIDKAGNILARKFLLDPLLHNHKNEILWDLVKDDHIYSTICRLADLYDGISREDVLCDGNRGWQDDRYYRFSEKIYDDTLNNFKKRVFARINKIRNDLQDLEVSAYFDEDRISTLKEENLSRIFLTLRLNGKVGCRADYLLIPSNIIKDRPEGTELKINIAMKDGENEAKKEVYAKIDNKNNMLQIPIDCILYPALTEHHIGSESYMYEIETYPKTYYLEVELKDGIFDFYNIRQWLKRDNGALALRNTATGQTFSASVRNFDASGFIAGDLRNIVSSRKISNKSVFSNSQPEEIFWEGDINLVQDTIIKKDQVLYIKPGTKVRIAPEVSLVVKGKILAQGKPEAPINFGSLEDNKDWGSIAIDDSSSSNIFSYCLFRHGNMNKEKMYNGALYVYRSNVTIENCDFYDNSGEDALNCQQSQVKILNCKFYRNAGDGIDFDSCQGEISASSFKDNKGDAIDLSDSVILIKDNTILFSGDKGISAGENSSPEIINNLISDNTIGVAVKDHSKAIIYKCKIINNQIGLALYQKKEFFGGGKAMVCSSILKNNSVPLECDKKSEVKFFDSQ